MHEVPGTHLDADWYEVYGMSHFLNFSLFV